MIPIAKGKFSKPRTRREDFEAIPAYIPPIREPVRDSSLEETMLINSTFEPTRDPSMEETMLVTGGFDPIRDPSMEETMLVTGVLDPVRDPSMEETMVVTGDFDPDRDASLDESTLAAATMNLHRSNASGSASQDSVTFEEAEFLQQTTVYNTEDPMIDQKFAEDDYDYEEAPRKKVTKKRARQRKILWASIITVSLLLVAAIILGISMFRNTAKDDGLILNNVTVAGINIGGMTPEAAAAAIHRATDMTYTVENMVIYLPDTILELSPKDTGAKLDVNAAVEAAYNYGRTGTSFGE